MLVLEDKKALVLNLRNPERVTSVIPTARQFMHKGVPLVAVKHGLDESIVLRNLGIKAPSPISYDYDWPRNEMRIPKPFVEQKTTSEFLTLNPRAFVLSSLGTGKTVSTLWAADYLMTKKRVTRALIVSTLSTLDRVWADEIMEHFPHRTAVVLHASRENRHKLLDHKVDFYIINHDGLAIIADALEQRPDINMVIVDEVASFRNSNTKRWKALNRIVAKRRWAWGLTGTPTPNAPTDAYGQCKLLVPQRVPRYFGAFKDMTMQQISTYKWIPRANAVQVVHNAMQPSIRFSREDMVELPEVMYETRHAPMTDAQSKVYKTMFSQLAANIEGNIVTAANDAVAASKLLQVACGVVYDNSHDQIQIPPTHRMEVLKEVLEEVSSGKAIVFAPFRSVVEWLHKELSNEYDTEFIHGGVSKTERNRIFSKIQSNATVNKTQVLVAHPGAMAHGITLTKANTIIWFSPIYSAETYEQANGRINRPGQKNNMLIVHVEGCELERRIYTRLAKKQRLQGLLLDMVKHGA